MRTQGITARQPRPGAALLETALVLNVLILGVLGVFEYGRLVMLRQLMQNAAREGARLAVVGTASNPEVTTAQIQNTVISYLAGQSISGVTVQVYQANPTTGADLGAGPGAGKTTDEDMGGASDIEHADKTKAK